LARFRLFGIPVSIHPSALVVVLLLGWVSGFTRVDLMAIWVGVVLVSLIVHELGHALTARSMGSEVSIELNGLGGLTRWTAPTGGLTPGRNALVAAAGSASGFALAGAVWLGREILGPFAGMGEQTVLILLYVNVVWGLLNWLPVRPLDGGHLLVSFLARVAPERGAAIARVIFLVTAGAGLLAAIRYRLYFAGLLAAWMLFEEMGGGRSAEPIPEFGYEGTEDPAGESGQRPPAPGADEAVADEEAG
jgi:stage IV sporulation protein FB